MTAGYVYDARQGNCLFFAGVYKSTQSCRVTSGSTRRIRMKDKGGTPYTPPTSKPATYGTKVTIHTPNGPKSGSMGSGGRVVPNK